MATSAIANPIEPQSPNALVQGGWLRLACDPNGQLVFNDQPVAIAGDGVAFVAFDRDAPNSAKLWHMGKWTGPQGYQMPLTIAPRAWRVEHVDAPFHPPTMPDETFVAIRKEELARISAARAVNAQSNGWRQNFIWPGKARLSGLFGSQRSYRGGVSGSYHSGTDIALSGGTIYHAPADGIVTLAADHPFTLEGNLLMLDHGMGLSSAFLHSSALLVKEGGRVTQGQPIGRVGMSGRATGPHLHWSMRWREARLDPMLFAGPMV